MNNFCMTTLYNLLKKGTRTEVEEYILATNPIYQNDPSKVPSNERIEMICINALDL